VTTVGSSHYYWVWLIVGSLRRYLRRLNNRVRAQSDEAVSYMAPVVVNNLASIWVMIRAGANLFGELRDTLRCDESLVCLYLSVVCALGWLGTTAVQRAQHRGAVRTQYVALFALAAAGRLR
jgi:hypothetical protein